MNKRDLARLIRKLLTDELLRITATDERVEWRVGESSDPQALLVLGTDGFTGGEAVYRITVERM